MSIKKNKKDVIILHTVTDADFYRSIFADRPRCRNGCVACYAPISAPCYRQKSTRYKFRIRDRVKYMSQGYHTNATTNMHSREIIQQSTLTNIELAERFEINEKTVSKWKNRDHVVDKSSRPQTIQRSLTDLEREVIRVVRTLTWIELDDLVGSVLPSTLKLIEVTFIEH